jgi:hypothetical protein
MTGLEIYDRYDFLATLLIGALVVGALELGAPFWALALLTVVGCVGLFIRHFDEIMWP